MIEALARELDAALAREKALAEALEPFALYDASNTVKDLRLARARVALAAHKEATK